MFTCVQRVPNVHAAPGLAAQQAPGVPEKWEGAEGKWGPQPMHW